MTVNSNESDEILKSKQALPNKLLQDDDTVTDILGNPVAEMVPAYEGKPALPNKFLNPDGSYSTLNQIIASVAKIDLFIIEEILPEVGEKNEIYLIPNGTDSYDEYLWDTKNNQWDKIGEIDKSNLVTRTDVEEMINTSVLDVLGGEY